MTPVETRFFNAWNQLPAPFTLPEEINPAFKANLIRQFSEGRFLTYYSTVFRTGLRNQALSHFMTCNPHGTYLWAVLRGNPRQLQKIMEDESTTLTERARLVFEMTDHVAVRQVAGYYDADCIYRDYEIIAAYEREHENDSKFDGDYILICFGLNVNHIDENIPSYVIEACSTKYYRDYTEEQKKTVVDRIMTPPQS